MTPQEEEEIKKDYPWSAEDDITEDQVSLPKNEMMIIEEESKVWNPVNLKNLWRSDANLLNLYRWYIIHLLLHLFVRVIYKKLKPI